MPRQRPDIGRKQRCTNRVVTFRKQDKSIQIPIHDDSMQCDDIPVDEPISRRTRSSTHNLHNTTNLIIDNTCAENRIIGEVALESDNRNVNSSKIHRPLNRHNEQNCVICWEPNTSETSDLGESNSSSSVNLSIDVDRNKTVGKRKRSEVENVILPPAFRYSTALGEKYARIVDVGHLAKQCGICQAVMFKSETQGFCCSNGSVRLPKLKEPPALLKKLLNGEDSRSVQFLQSVKKYNMAFAMTSLGCNEITYSGQFMPTFKICGHVYHRIGSLHSQTPSHSQFLQIYFLNDLNDQAAIRSQFEHLSNNDLLLELQEMLYNNNQYVQRFKSLYSKIMERGDNITDMKIVIKNHYQRYEHRGRTNAPSVNEVAVLIQGDYSTQRDIVIEGSDGSFKSICETHQSYDPLQYPLLYPYGEDGYNLDINLIQRGKKSNKKVSAMQYYKYRLMIREDNYLIYFKTLFNIFLVDMYVKIESERALYCRLQQKRLRSEEYGTLRDAITTDNIVNTGRLVILPSSFTGSPRYMHEKMQDGMSYIRKYGTADFFITMTCNPKWCEIQKALLPNQVTSDRHDIIARVFNLKVRKLMDLIKKEHIFGEPKAFMYTIEWQKRGLPHIHIILWLKDRMTSDKVDYVISAEIPDPIENLVLHNLVKAHMIHGPCGEYNINCVCMVNGNCSKRYPKTFTNETITSDSGYPLYKRRSIENGGFTTFINDRFKNVDNRWVVPYNSLLLHALNAHINVEACYSVKAIKYICKYIVKGTDLATVSVEVDKTDLTSVSVDGNKSKVKTVVAKSKDEIEHYINGRYVSSSEAAWRIFGFMIHEHYPPIVHLSVHLENGQRVYFDESNLERRMESIPVTTLTAFFELCRNDDFAATLLYDEVPLYYTWHEKKFLKRKRGTPVSGYDGYFYVNAIGRVYTIHPTQIECFHLRMLLFVVRGPKSFADLRTYNGVVYSTYIETCKARGMLRGDMQWEKTMDDAVLTQTAYHIRELFVMIILFCEVSDVIGLYNTYKNNMAEDIIHRKRQQLGMHVEYNEHIYQESLILIDSSIQSYGIGKTARDFNLPIKDTNINYEDNLDLVRETSYNETELIKTINERQHNLNTEQLEVYNIIVNAVENKEQKMFFLDAPGGTGKTYLINLLLARIRKLGKIALAVASSGIAATLLDGGRTVHSTFKVPTVVHKDTVCNITKQCGLAKLLNQCNFFVWDECSMSHKYVLEAIDRTLKFLRNSKEPMGGITVLFAGDFRQTLPVVKRGTRADIVNASLKYSELWEHVITLPKLIKNVRLMDGSDEFSQILLQIGNGTYPTHNGFISYSSFANSVPSFEDLINAVWPSVENIKQKGNSWIKERTILAPLNNSVDMINNIILDHIPSEMKVYTSIDYVMNNEESVLFPTEFLNSLDISGLPPHILTLKEGIPIMLTRNLKPPKLCNGTRLIVNKLMENLIEATILTGIGEGECVCIPKIPLLSSDSPIEFKRIQFPVKVCFAITINKAQGQSFKYVGLNLIEPCFSHGQLYVGCSRSITSSNLFIYSEDNYSTENVVYKEIFVV